MKHLELLLSKYKEDKPGLAVSVIKGKEVLYEKYIGLANMEYDIPISRKTVFNLASLSKPFTALGILILVEKGLLSLNDKITGYFPELIHSKDVTIRHLLNHTSGIINYYDILRRKQLSDLFLTNEKCFQLLSEETENVFPAGQKFDYSNSNYVLLALLIEKVSKKSLDSFLRENIFLPFEMNQSRVYNELHPIIKERAYGYLLNEGEYHCDYYGALTTGDGCLYTSMNDLIQFVYAIWEKKLISAALWEEAFTDDKFQEYGYGWELRYINRKPRQIFHSGADNGTRTLLVLFPDNAMSVIVLSNYNLPAEEKRLIVDKVIEDLGLD